MPKNLNFKQFNKKDLIQTALSLFAITMAAALLMALVNAIVYDRIVQNNEMFKQASMQKTINADTYEKIDYTPTGAVKEIFAATKSGQVIGYAVMVHAQGFGGDISLIVGIDNSGAIIGMQTVTMSETPGIGTQVEDDAFKSQFVGKKNEIKIVKTVAETGNEVTAVSGATVSSTAVVAAVNEVLKEIGYIIDIAG